MSGNYLLDTSVLIELFARDTNILARLEKAESTFIPSIALGELQYQCGKSHFRQAIGRESEVVQEVVGEKSKEITRQLC